MQLPAELPEAERPLTLSLMSRTIAGTSLNLERSFWRSSKGLFFTLMPPCAPLLRDASRSSRLTLRVLVTAVLEPEAHRREAEGRSGLLSSAERRSLKASKRVPQMRSSRPRVDC
jgi:hypothetical protein